MSVVLNDFVQPQRSDTFTGRFTDAQCAALVSFANRFGYASVEELTRVGVNALRTLAELGAAFPIATPPPDNGTCEVTTTWPTGELQAGAPQPRWTGASPTISCTTSVDGSSR